MERHISLGFLDPLPDLVRVMEGVHLLKEYHGIRLDLLKRLGTFHVFTDVRVISRREKLKSLQELLEFSSFPFYEPFRLDNVLLDFHFGSKIGLFNALNIAIVLRLHLNFE